ncbi:DPP IV N-terminal domain-containing protein [Hyphobacterium sp.]|uniref:S9 family peptidase n=1 Tax=Hyphobacterium sp. TaxID=2004662 RepID=UPI00374938B0
MMSPALMLLASLTLIQDAQPAELTIERLYASPGLNGPVATATRFSPDGGLITFLQGKEEDASVQDLWAIDVDGGEPFLLVDSRVLAPEERALSEAEIQLRERARISGSGIVTYDWDARGEALLFPLDGDVFYYELETGEARRLMETEAAETDSRISPSGRYVGFVREQNLFVQDLESGETRAITSDGGGTLTYATAEFVAQEEMDRSTGYWFSSDDRYVAFTAVDESPVPASYRVDIAGDGATVTEQRYPYAGEANVGIRLFIEHIETGQRVEADLGEDSDIYLARANWGVDGRLYIQRQNRAQSVLDLIAVDPETGDAVDILTERDPAWVNLTNDLTFLDDGSFLWTSERTGFRHIYHYAADGGLIDQVTSGEWQINAIEGVDQDAGRVYFSGWMTDPRQRQLYSVSYVQSGEAPTRITSGAGWWSGISMSAGAQTFLGSYSDPQTPTNTALYDASGQRLRWIEENALDAEHPYFPYLDNHIVPERGTITAADGTELHYIMYLPAGFDPDRQYPAIINVYGGPGVGRRTRMSWGSLEDQLFAQNGYIYFKLDNRGTPDRGHAFETALHRAMGGVEVEDQLAGLAFLRSLDYVADDRIGIWGWSYGGYMSLMTTLQAPGEFAAAVSGAPVTDWALYDTHYTERYMGTPQNNPDGYMQSSVFGHLDGWETPILIMHGMADDNVVFENSTRLFSLLQENDLPFEMMTYPGQRHGIRGEMRGRHRTRTILDFFDRHLQPAD